MTGLNDDVVNEIFSWFEKNTKAGSQQVGPMYVGVYYYDSCFWPVVIPIVFGSVRLNLRDFLKTMPESILTRLWTNGNKLKEYVSVSVDCMDYVFGLEDRRKISTLCEFAKELFWSGDQQLKATISLLLERSPNPRSMESARMATEMFFKALLAAKAGLTEKDAQDKIRHNLEKALAACLPLDVNSELKTILPYLKVFPGIEDRYKCTNKAPSELWRANAVAQFVGTTVVRLISGYDTRSTIRVTTS
jgi:hypothetical protein